jgi:hypothetical protein
MRTGERINRPVAVLPSIGDRLVPWPHGYESNGEGPRHGDRERHEGGPWVLKTPPGTSEYTMYRDDAADPPVIVCQVGGTRLLYDAQAIDDLHAMLKAHGDWMPLGGADEQKPASEGTVEAWGRSESNPRGGWYGVSEPRARGFRQRRSAVCGEARGNA